MLHFNIVPWLCWASIGAIGYQVIDWYWDRTYPIKDRVAGTVFGICFAVGVRVLAALIWK